MADASCGTYREKTNLSDAQGPRKKPMIMKRGIRMGKGGGQGETEVERKGQKPRAEEDNIGSFTEMMRVNQALLNEHKSSEK